MRDESGLTDEVTAELNPEFPPDEGEPGYEEWLAAQEQVPAVPDRPADSAVKEEWLAYCIALGASESIGRETHHFDAEADRKVAVPALTKAELQELAGRLGG